MNLKEFFFFLMENITLSVDSDVKLERNLSSELQNSIMVIFPSKGFIVANN